jgi:hypothetical protein
LSVILCLAAGAFVIRRSGLHWLWLTYPPVATGILLGQPGVIVVALLLTRLAAAAPLLKPWAGIPLLFRPRVALIAVGLGIATFLVASGLWLEWLRRFSELSARLSNELHGGVPIWANVAGAVALFVIWRRRPSEAPWLAVSALWPFPEYHNAILALPTRRRAVLLLLALVPGPAVVVGYALWIVAEPTILRSPTFGAMVVPDRLVEATQ